LALPFPLCKTTFIVGWVDARKPNNSYYSTANVGFHFVQPNLQKLNYCQSSQDDQDAYMSDIAEIINNAKKQVEGVDNKRSNQKINTISNSKKTYLNGVEIPRKGKTAAISL